MTNKTSKDLDDITIQPIQGLGLSNRDHLPTLFDDDYLRQQQARQWKDRHDQIQATDRILDNIIKEDELYKGPRSRPQNTVPGGFFTPRPRKDGLARGWSNGYSFIEARDRPGLSLLKISNGTDQDAVTKIFGIPQSSKITEPTLCRFVYVCSKRSVSINGIGPGEYSVLFSLGNYWDRKMKRFTQAKISLKFNDPLMFAQTYKGGAATYSSNELTLHAVTDGKAKTSVLNQDEFDLFS